MKIKFCGAAREVTGSCHLVTLDDGYNILLDCGLYQGNDKDMESFNQNWRFRPEDINCLILSHAHIDHSGRIPKFVKDGFKGNIYATPATQSLTAILLMDSAKIQETDVEWDNRKWKKDEQREKPLYTVADVAPAMQRFISFSYDRWIRIRDGVELMYRDSGHILGSASVTLRITENGKTTMLGFTADIGRPNRPILRDPVPMPQVDYLICESTYGDRLHPAPPEELHTFLSVIRETCVEKRGKLIIPAFSVGRTQELVYMLDKLQNSGELPPIKIYVDSPLAINATQIYGSHPECYDDEMSEYMLKDPNPFGFNSLYYIRDAEDSKKLNNMREPCIIISAAGMMNAGRIRHHLFNNIENPNNTFLIVGYCAPDTAGGILMAGAKEIKILGELKQVRAEIRIMESFSSHGDQKEMLDYISNQKGSVKRIFLVHGEYDVQERFSVFLNQNGFDDVVIPNLGNTFELN